MRPKLIVRRHDTFGACSGGTGNPPAPTCPPGVDADLDHDGDVDTEDFAIFGARFTGINPAGCIGAGGVCGGESAMGGGEQDSPSADSDYPIPPLDIILEDPLIAELYEELQEICATRGVPCT